MKDYRINESLEYMQNNGASTIATEDLLTLIIGNREKAVKMLHQNATLFSGTKDGLSCLAGEDFDGLKYMGGLSQMETARLFASLELGRRIAYARTQEAMHITSPGDAAAYFMPRLRHETHEKFYVMMLNTKNRIIRVKQISEGSLSSSVVHPREVLSAAITAHAAAILVSHLHPSGIPTFSAEDKSLTTALESASNAVGIVLIDHIIVGSNSYFSFKEKGLL